MAPSTDPDDEDEADAGEVTTIAGDDGSSCPTWPASDIEEPNEAEPLLPEAELVEAEPSLLELVELLRAGRFVTKPLLTYFAGGKSSPSLPSTGSGATVPTSEMSTVAAGVLMLSPLELQLQRWE